MVAMVAANDPVPDPVTSPVSVIVWSPVFVPLTDVVPVTASVGVALPLNVIPLTDVGVMAPSVIVRAGVVVALATVAETPLALTTETVVTVPELLVYPLGLLAGYAPRFVNACDAVLAPVPPSAMARSVMPAMLPPVIATLAADCVDIVLNASTLSCCAAVKTPAWELFACGISALVPVLDVIVTALAVRVMPRFVEPPPPPPLALIVIVSAVAFVVIVIFDPATRVNVS